VNICNQNGGTLITIFSFSLILQSLGVQPKLGV
jgi:hypothetical protein